MTAPSTITVLMIDDDEALANLTGRTFRRAGMEFVHAPSGDAGLERLRGGGIDAVLLDHFMQGETGLDVLPKILGLTLPPPVVYMTASDETTLAITALKAGAADYVLKDVQREELRRQKIRAENEVRAARDRAEALLQEVNHRVANSLSLVSALVAMQERALGPRDETAKAALVETGARITAIARVHKHLYISGDARAVSVKDYLGELVGQMAGSIEEGGPRLLFDCDDDVTLSSDKAVSLGVVATELVTNAIKYAYPNGEAGDICVSVRREGEQVVFCVRDQGVGYSPSDKPQGSGLGTRIIDAMRASLGARLEQETENGSSFVLRFRA